MAESTGFVVSQCETVKKDVIYKDVETLIKSYTIHFKFDTSHFNAEAMGKNSAKVKSNMVNMFYSLL